MTKNILFILIFVLNTSLQAFETDELSAEVKKGMDLWHVPGMSVAVVSKDNINFQQGFGTTDITNGQAVDEHTLFAIASTTKAMVVAGLLMLADEGKLSMDDLAIKHIPELHFKDPALAPQLTLRDLLSHSTGLPSTDLWSFLQDYTLEKQIRLFPLIESQSAVRTRLIYQNTMYELSGLILKRVSGQEWHEFLSDRLWQPLGMMETFASPGLIPKKKPSVSRHLYYDNEIKFGKSTWDLNDANSAGSVWSSIYDMSLWAQFLLRGGKTADGKALLSDNAIKQMFEPTNIASPEDFYPTIELTKPNWRTYGLGWFQQDFQGRKIDFHTGSLAGLIALIGLDRANDKAVIVLGNQDHAEMRHALLWNVMDNSPIEQKRDWNQDIFDMYARNNEKAKKQRAEQQNSRIPDTKPSLALDEYLGTYRHESSGDIQVKMTNGVMTLEFPRAVMYLKHWHLDVFQLLKKEWDMETFASFSVGVNGKVNQISFFGQEFNKIPASK